MGHQRFLRLIVSVVVVVVVVVASVFVCIVCVCVCVFLFSSSIAEVDNSGHTPFVVISSRLPVDGDHTRVPQKINSNKDKVQQKH